MRGDVRRYLLRRFLFGLGVVWGVTSIAWALIEMKPTRTGPLGALEGGGLQELSVQGYLDFIVGYLTLNPGEGVGQVWAEGAPVTLLYLLPALVLAGVLGVGVATYAAMVPGGYADRLVSTVSHLGIGLPTFVLAGGLIAVAPSYGIVFEAYDPRQPLLHPDNVTGMMVPMVLLALPLFAFVTRYARQESLNERTAEYVKTARAKGAGRLRLAAHVLRNSWLALVQVLFSELLGLILLSTIVIEYVFGLDGLAIKLFRAFESADGPVAVSAVVAVVVLGVVGTWFQDVARLFLVPNRSE